MRIGLFAPSQRQQPFAEFVKNEWRIWIAFNPDVTSGTYYVLSPIGGVERVTVLDGIVLDIINVTQMEKIDEHKRGIESNPQQVPPNRRG